MGDDQKTFNPELQLGLLPPQAVELEVAVLASLLTDGVAVQDEVMQILKVEHFYKYSHSVIYKAAVEMRGRGDGVDMITLVQYLSDTKELEDAGGPYAIAQITNQISTFAIQNCYIIKQKWLLRSLINEAGKWTTEGYKGERDVFEMLSSMQNSLQGIADQVISGESADLNSLADGLVADYHSVMDGSIPKDCARTGVEPLDEYFGYFEPGWNIKIGARPGMGKTTLVLLIALSLAKQGIPVLFSSLEMKAKALFRRLVCYEYDLDVDAVRLKKLTKDEQERFELGVKNLAKLPIYIEYTNDKTVEEVYALARHYKKHLGVKVVLNDYVQLMKSEGKFTNREGELTHISKTMNAMAKALDLIVFDCAQLSRKTEDRKGGSKPMLSDLRESGSLEQDADIVMMPYRPGYYDKDPVDEEGRPTKNEYWLYIRKYREGAMGKITMYWWKGKIFETQLEVETLAGLEPQQSNLPFAAAPVAEQDDLPF